MVRIMRNPQEGQGGVPQVQANQQVAKPTVIKPQMVAGIKSFKFNGSSVDPVKDAALIIKALQINYKLSVLRAFGIYERDENGDIMKAALEINGYPVKAKLPKINRDDAGRFTENLQQYFMRTHSSASVAYGNIMKGLEAIDFLPQLQ